MSTKTVFERAPHEAWKVFLPEAETYIYHNFHLRPNLTNTLQPGKEFIIFLTAEIEFNKIANVEDTTTIFSSFRNQRWLTIEHNCPNFIQNIVDELLTNFHIQIMEDIESLQNKKESGWSYNKMINMSVVKLERDILLGPSYGHRGTATPKTTYKIQPHLRANINQQTIIIPHDRYTPKQFLSDRNLCVPLAIALKLEHLRNGKRYINKSNIAKVLSALRYQELRTAENNFKIARKDFDTFENINKGFGSVLLQLYPFLHYYVGFALNCYKHLGSSKRSIRFTTTHLSKKWNKSQFFQIDLLESDGVLSPPVADHVLPIINFPAFISPKSNNRHPNACRNCHRLYTVKKQSSYKKHILHHCSSKATSPRRLHNNIIHRAFLKDKQTGKKTRHVVTFHPRQFHATFQCLVFGAMDFEATSKKATPGLIDKKAPSSTIMFQKPFAMSLCYVSPYNLPLPKHLKDITVKFYDERHTTLDDFYLAILTTLRQHVADINKFTLDAMTRDKGPPHLNSLDNKDRDAYLKARNCSFCNIEFGTRIPSKKHKNHFYTVKKVKHHDHFITVPNLAKKGFRQRDLDNDNNNDNEHKVIVLCSNCNLATYQDGFLTRSDLRYFLHNAGKYDFCFVSDMLARVGHTEFSQIDDNGLAIETPLLKDDPTIICKDKNSIISIAIRFNCSQLASCPYHSSTPNVDSLLTRKMRSCPYERRLVFCDSAMMMCTSVDAMLQDVRTIHEGKKDLRLVFPRTHHFITSQMEYNEDVFDSVLSKKIPQPFEMIDSLQYTLDLKQAPPIAHFFSNLKGDNITGKPSVSQEDYSNFLDIWRKINAESYFDLLALYAGADASILGDVLAYYYGYIYAVSGLDALQYPTAASFSFQAALYNSKSPYNNGKPLEIHVPSKKVAKIFSLGLRGGYAFVNANFCEFRHLEVEQTNSVPYHFLKQISFEDINGLYASLLRQRIPIGDYLVYCKKRNRRHFDMLTQRLLNMDIKFFSEELHKNNHLYFFVVVLSYDNDALFAKQNIDLSLFPFYENVSLDQLSNQQRVRAARLKRNPQKESPQLVSYLKKDLETSDYAENIIYLCAFHNIFIKKIVKIVRCTAFPVFDQWLSRLEEEKRYNVSPILNRLWKSFGNNICGKVRPTQ